MTYTTSPIRLTDGIEHLLNPFRRIGVPAHELAMMMTIALRFIPTLLDETDRIMKAQSARGADFVTGSIIQRAKNMVPLLVPLFISAFKMCIRDRNIFAATVVYQVVKGTMDSPLQSVLLLTKKSFMVFRALSVSLKTAMSSVLISYHLLMDITAIRL